MKYLHLINDEKFTDFTISLFEECNQGNNIFLVGINGKNTFPKYTQARNEQVIFHISGSMEYFRYIDNCTFDVLVVHFMDYYKSIAIRKVKNNPIILWLAWGADIYGTTFYKQNIYQRYTSDILKRIENKLIEKIKNRFRNLYYLLSFRIPPSVAYKHAVEKVNFCATVIPDEIDLLREWGFFHARQVPYSYASIEYDFKQDEVRSYIKGDGIIVGNSIDPSSNHMDVFKKLDVIGIKNRKIVVPLNYGSKIYYRDAILNEAKRIFDKDFEPLLNFISKHEYINILKECNIAIMNHDRQQGVGNLIILLWTGCKIFLSDKSVTFSYFKRKGFFVYSFQQDLNAESIKTSLTEEQITKNRELLIYEYGHENVQKKVMILINEVSNSFK